MATSREHSAGILLYRRGVDGLEMFLGHMGGPFWAKKTAGAWSIPKGLIDDDEDPLAAALREFEEEVGTPPPAVEYVHLRDVRYTSGKIVTVFAAETDFEIETLTSGTFELEWPRGSGRFHTVPEIDLVAWVSLADARTRLVKGQVPLVDAIVAIAARD